jgi:hypothetical protein
MINQFEMEATPVNEIIILGATIAHEVTVMLRIPGIASEYLVY